MELHKLYIELFLVTCALNVITSQRCPKEWKEFGSSCYRFVVPTLQIRQKSWEDARANCLGYGADLVSIRNSTEMDFIYNTTSQLGNLKFWIGFFRNKTTNFPNEGWVWSDGSSSNNTIPWSRGEPNNYKNNENCAEFFARSKDWSDNDCAKSFAYICKRRKGLPDPTTPNVSAITPTKAPPPLCDFGWMPYNRSCYRFFEISRSWNAAKTACRDTGGHLLRINDDSEQHFVAYIARPKTENFWIGLNNLSKAGQWMWEFGNNDTLTYTNWQSGEPNGFGIQQCVEMYSSTQAGFWNDAGCQERKFYICEKEEGHNVCPDGWIAYGNNCYQFNMLPSQKITWSAAEAACKAFGNFAALVTIRSQNEQDFIKRMMQRYNDLNAWIGLNDIAHENVFEWTGDNSVLDVNDFKIWTSGKPIENRKEWDCVTLLGLRVDAAWTVQSCSQLQNYICMRHRDLPYCNAPLGMENGRILDRQITASSFQTSHEPTQARLKHSGSWCPSIKNQEQYLQVELPYLADIRKIVTEGNITSYILKASRDGRGYKTYKTSTGKKELTPTKLDSFDYLDTKSLVAKFIRIFPKRWNVNKSPCLRVDFSGCPAQVFSKCGEKNWISGPGDLCLQINKNYATWTEARSSCIERGGDLLTISTYDDMRTIKTLLQKISAYSDYWISLNDRDYNNVYYWTNSENTAYLNWGSGSPNRWSKVKKCTYLKAWTYSFLDEDCSRRFQFICMKRGQRLRTNIIHSGPTGVWMSSAKYYWPLSDDEVVLGTRSGKLNGKITLATGVKGKPNSALQFSGEGSFIDVGKFDKECFGNPDYCLALTFSFMAWFDDNSISSPRRLNILDSIDGDEMTNNGLGVYLEKNEMYFVISKTSNYFKSSISIVANEWRHYVMIFSESSGLSIFVNGQIAPSVGSTRTGKTDKSTRSFRIGLYYHSSVKNSKIKISMVAFWDKMLSAKDISSIYNAEFGVCLKNWIEYGMSCYQLNKNSRSYYFAQRRCQSSGGDLVNIGSNVEQAFITTWQLKYKVFRSWIGVHDKYKEGSYVDTDDNSVVYSNWAPNQPDDWYGEDCIHILGNGMWNDLSCYRYNAFICEKSKSVPVHNSNVTQTNTTLLNLVSTITKFETFCHYTRSKIGCPNDLVINITSAFWGRRDKKLCAYISVLPCGEKDIPIITKNLKKKCDAHGSCAIHASESESYLTDPCPTINKYLQVNYTCVKDHSRKYPLSGWKNFEHDNNLYRLFDTPRTWHNARKLCRDYGAELLSIKNQFEQSAVTSLMERTWYEKVWIGFNDITGRGVYGWSDGSEVSWTNWYVGQPDERLLRSSCVSMNLHRGKRGWMFWSDENCTKEYPFVCKKSFKPVIKPTPTKKPSYPGKCYPHIGWFTNDRLRYCYFYKSGLRKNWFDANLYCKNSLSSTLVSVYSAEENAFVMKLSNDSMWIGLDSKGVYRGYIWANRGPVKYTNWEIGQPDSYNGLEACVEINPDTGTWSDRDCRETKNFVCMKEKRKITPTASQNVYPTPGSTLCRQGWTLFNGMCYIVGYQTSSEYISWFEAEERCKKLGNGGHLVSIHNKDEGNFLKFLRKNSRARNFWIGLNDVGTEAHYQWTDGSNYDYVNWNSRQPDDYHRQENCIHTYIYTTAWNDNHCQRKFSYICKAYNESYKPPMQPTEVPRPAKDKYCPDGWVAHAQYCYEFHTDPREYRTWDEARDACELGHNSSAYGELVSIHDEFEEAFITTRLKGVKQWLWIGLNNKLSAYFWSDNSPTNYLKWNTREPRGWSKCVEIVPYRWAAGRWNAASCFKKNGYICKKVATKAPPNSTVTPKEKKCKIGYKSYDESCYKFVNAKKTFDDARKFCKKEGGDLMIINDQFKQAYLIYLLERFVGDVWIGYIHEPYSVFKFVDNSLTAHTYWGPGQPSRRLEQRSCVQANVTRSVVGFWDDVDCSSSNSFVCEIYNGDPKVTVPINGTCPDGWKFYYKHCYKYFARYLSWSQAQFTCSKYSANLISIHDDREQDFLIYFFQSVHPRMIWTGLNDRAVERGYEWIDSTPLDYINWMYNEPNDYSQSENCVEMQTRSGQWNDMRCYTRRHFMCKKKLECSGDIPIDTSMVTVTDTRNSTTMGADKAIFTNENDGHTWCTNNTSGNSKIMIDLNNLYQVTGITVAGFKNKYVKEFRLEYEHDEDWRVYYPLKNFQALIQLFSPNPSKKEFKFPFKADGLKITPVTWFGEDICMKVKLHGCSYVCQRQLFFSSPSRIKDYMISASSAKYPKYEPKQTAIEGHAWCSMKNDKKQWIQFKFPRESKVSTILTFGDRKKSYVKSYYMQFSDDGENWSNYVRHGTTRIFQGNNDANSPVRHTLENEIEATYVRVLPVSWIHNICMRISLLGCYADCSKPLLASGRAVNPQFDSSVQNSHPEYALFNTGKAWCTGNTPNEYLQIKFGEPYILYKIATLPSPVGYHNESGLSQYTLEVRKGGSYFVYGPRGKAKIFVAINENDPSRPMIHDITDFMRQRSGLRTKAIRIYPQTNDGSSACIRVELYGCLSGVEILPTTPPTTQKVVNVSLRFTSLIWNDKLSDPKSEEFIETSKLIIKAIESVFTESESFRNAKVLKLIKGSVVATIELVFNPIFVQGDNATSLLENAVHKGKIGSLTVDPKFFNVETPESSARKESDSRLSGGIIALIVLILLLAVALISALAFFVYRRRKQNTFFTPKHFDNPVSFSSKAYDMDD